MDANIIKNIIILSLILGTILGVIATIPYIGIIGLLALFLLSAPLVIIYLIMDAKLDLTTIKDTIVNSAVIGFVTSISFSVVYAIIIVLLDKIFGYSNNLILTKMIENSPIFLFVLSIFFMGVVYATTNAFSGFLTFYSINFIRDMYEKKQLKEDNNDRI